MIRFELPGEPIAFARARSNGARRFTPAPQASYMQAVAWAAKIAMGGRPMLEGPLSVRVRGFYLAPSTWSRVKRETTLWKTSVPDVDNIAKLPVDAIRGIVFRDDAQVAELVVTKQYGPAACLVVTIEPMGVA